MRVPCILHKEVDQTGLQIVCITTKAIIGLHAEAQYTPDAYTIHGEAGQTGLEMPGHDRQRNEDARFK